MAKKVVSPQTLQGRKQDTSTIDWSSIPKEQAKRIDEAATENRDLWGKRGEAKPLPAEQWADSNDWISVSSTNVSAIRYDKLRERLYVEFLPSKKFPAGPVYFYLSVSEDVAVEFYNAGSMGVFVHARLIGRYAVAGPFASRFVAP